MSTNLIARQIMYAWHSGCSSELYKAASSGLVESEDSFVLEVQDIEGAGDKQYLLDWWDEVYKTSTTIYGKEYIVLPWCKQEIES